MSGISAGARVVALGLGMIAGGISMNVQAQGVVNVPRLSAAVANQVVGDTVAICAQRGYRVVAVIVDLDGTRQAMLRGDGAPIHSVDNAFYKAYSSASLTLGRKEGSTKEVADRISKNPPSGIPYTPLPNVTYGQGGVAIMAGGAIIGGLGVSGAPGGQLDEACARDALAKVHDKLK